MGSSNTIKKVEDFTKGRLENLAQTLDPFIVGKAIEKRKEKKATEAQQQAVLAATQPAREAVEEERKKAETAEEAVRQQKEKARRRTIFAGQDIRESLFRRRLGGDRTGRSRILGG